MIETHQLTVRVGDFQLRDIDMVVPGGTYCVLMGKTGSGKTTLMESVCGLKRVQGGKIILDGQDVTHLKPAERGIGFVPQEGALFASMSVQEHLRFALMVRKWKPAEMQRRVAELAELLHLDHLLHRHPKGLSGGESQRVALGRALSFRPSILCLDEPLSALDDESRLELIELLKRVQKETGVTALHVTHSHSEAKLLADLHLRIVDGKVREVEE